MAHAHGTTPARSDRSSSAVRKLWGPQEVADYLGVPVGTVYQWRSRGYGPPGRRVGKHVRYKPADVEAWFEAQAEGAA